jgi:hypothetical protein
MTQRLIVFTFFILASFVTKSQTVIDSTVLNNVKCQPLDMFFKKTIEATKKLDLKDITNSKNKIEIRLYETYELLDLTYCTTLYLDTTFKLSRQKYWHKPDEAKEGLEEKNPIALLRADSVFKVLIKNEIFNFGDIKNHQILDSLLALKGVPKMERPMFFGIDYVLEYKVGEKYNRVWWSTPQLCAKAFPDDSTFKRQNAIVSALGVRLQKRF